MTDNKTPEWVERMGQAIADSKALGRAIAEAEQRGYDRGRKEGIEEAAKVAEKETEAPAQRNAKSMWVQDIGDRLATAHPPAIGGEERY